METALHYRFIIFISGGASISVKMAPVLRKGLMCCLSLRTCALILGSITLVSFIARVIS